MALESMGLSLNPLPYIQRPLPSYTLGGSRCCCSLRSPQQSFPYIHSTALDWPKLEGKDFKIVPIFLS